MSSNDSTYTPHQPPEPNPDLQSLKRLVGTWKETGA